MAGGKAGIGAGIQVELELEAGDEAGEDGGEGLWGGEDTGVVVEAERAARPEEPSSLSKEFLLMNLELVRLSRI